MSRLPLYLGVALGLALLAAALLVPDAQLEVLTRATRLDTVLPQARPPFGMTARLLLGGGLVLACVMLGALLSRKRSAAPERAVEPTRGGPDLRASRPGPAVDAAIPTGRDWRGGPAVASPPSPTVRPPSTERAMPLEEARALRAAAPAPTVAVPAALSELPAPEVRPEPATPAPSFMADSKEVAMTPSSSEELDRLASRVDQMEERLTAQMAQIAQQLAEIAATTRQLARTPPVSSPAPAIHLRRPALADGDARSRVAQAARALKSSLPTLDG